MSKLIKDDDLSKVNGGGSGIIPSGGIKYAKTSWISDGYYYSSAENTNDVVYVFRNVPGGDLYYSKESFVCSGGTWQSTCLLGPIEIENEKEFLTKYPYIMNVRP